MTILMYVLAYLAASMVVLAALVIADYEPDFDDLRWYDRLALISAVPVCLGLALFEGGWRDLADEAVFLFRLIVLGRVDE